ncbi:hypothetical protein CFC21_009239 [Triticum aestivum]|uniref:Uncharacterized protein n=2 Tax=Triticum aestivum TaxID=4565 RepID=A0A9R1IT99_WHEAT|nr:hypothetical protein CFC21_009239 [Triticum aestivum]
MAARLPLLLGVVLVALLLVSQDAAPAAEEKMAQLPDGYGGYGPGYLGGYDNNGGGGAGQNGGDGGSGYP